MDAVIVPSSWLPKLEVLDADFKTIHLQLVNLIDKEDELDYEQEKLDYHADDVASLTVRLQQLIMSGGENRNVGIVMKNLITCFVPDDTAVAGVADGVHFVQWLLTESSFL